MNIRIKELRKSLKLSQKSFGLRLGVTGSSISHIESGERNITNQMMLSICREFNVKEDWLKYGEGEIIEEIKCLSEKEKALEVVGRLLATDDGFKRKLIVAIGELTDKEWNAVENFLNKLKD